jgi:tRNA (guanine-N7-)-methyltransferase
VFFLYADPHFKKSNWDRRIISVDLLDVYAYFLRIGGSIYTVTDVEDLHNWEVAALDAHPSFRKATKEEIEADPVVPVMLSCTDEAKKAAREGRGQWYTVHIRIDPRK